MKRVKTLKGFINRLRDIERQELAELKGYEKLDHQDRLLLGNLVGEISNILNDSFYDL